MADPEEITIIVHNATGLKSKLGGGHKFFVVFGLSETKYQTSVVVESDGNPVWNEENVVTVQNMKDEVFLIAREKDNVLGQVLVPLTSMNGEKGQMQKQALQPHKKCKKPQGELTYQCFVSKYRDPNKPLVEESENDNKNVGKRKFKLSFFGKEPGKQLEQITEVDSCTSSEPASSEHAQDPEVQEITLEELMSKKHDDTMEKSTETLVDDNENNDNKNVISNGVDKSSPKPMPRKKKKKNKEKDGNDFHENGEIMNLEEKEKEGDNYEKNKKKRFSLKFLKRKKLLDETKKALANNEKEANNIEDEYEEEIDSLDEILEKNSNILDEIDKASEQSELTSLSSADSRGKQDVVHEVSVEPVQKIFYTQGSDQEDADQGYDIEMKDIDIMDRVVYDAEEPGPSDQQSDNETDPEESDGQIVLGEHKNDGELEDAVFERDTDLGDGATSKEPIVEIEIGGKVKKKKRFSLKLKGHGSDKSASSPLEEGGRSPHLGVTPTPSPSISIPDKDKSKWKLNKKTPPEITKCTPNKGPVDEPTKVCIEGSNLGTGKADILSLKVAGCDCLDTVEFESPEKIYCKTHFQFESRTGPVEIITKSGGQGTLTDGYTFFDEIEKYTGKLPSKTVHFQAQMENVPRHRMEQSEFDIRSTEDINSLVQRRPKVRQLSRSSSETALSSHWVPHSFAEEQTESMFRVRQGRRLSEAGLKPRRKAPPVPTEEDIFAKTRLRRRASESAIKVRPSSMGRRASSGDGLKTKKMAPPPPTNTLKAKANRPLSLQLPDARRQNCLTPVEENEDREKREELLEKVRKLEEEKAVLQKDVTRLRRYIDNLVSRVMDRCPAALLQDNHLKTNLFV